MREGKLSSFCVIVVLNACLHFVRSAPQTYYPTNSLFTAHPSFNPHQQLPHQPYSINTHLYPQMPMPNADNSGTNAISSSQSSFWPQHQPATGASYLNTPQPIHEYAPGQPEPYSTAWQYHQQQSPVPNPSSLTNHDALQAIPQTSYHSAPYPVPSPLPPNISVQSGDLSASNNANPMQSPLNHITQPTLPNGIHENNHQQSLYPHMSPPQQFPSPSHTAYLQNPAINPPPPSYPTGYPSYHLGSNTFPSYGYGYDARQHSVPHHPSSPINYQYPHNNYAAGTNGLSYSSTTQAPKSTTKKVTTTARPKSKSSPKPFEFELSAEDFFYLMQLKQLFNNKSSDQQTIDLSSLANPTNTDEKDESPVFYGGVFDLEQLSKIDNMKDLMAAFQRVEPKSPWTRKDETRDDSGAAAESGTDSGDVEESVNANNKKRKSSSKTDATRNRNASHRKKGNKKKKPKESDRVDHGNEEDEDQDEDEMNGTVGDEESDEETANDEKITIGSIPTALQLGGRLRKKQRITTASTTTSTSTTTVSPLTLYHNPYSYSIPYNYPQMQMQYMQQLHAMQASQSAALAMKQPHANEATKLNEEETLAPSSPNENRNVITVNIADPQKSGSNDPVTPSDSYTGSQLSNLFPRRRGSFNSMANGLARKALSSLFYRIFPTMKHLNVKGVAVKGCRDVQSIGSLDSIIMPLGLAVTLHPLLLPLVPFFLLALGSIKAIESATCFVSEYFS